MKHNFSLDSGERQIGETLDKIRYDHIVRYKMAIEFLKGKKVNTLLDCFCGNGYGSYYMAKELLHIHVLGLDASKEAVDFANVNYNMDRIIFSTKEFPFALPNDKYDSVVSFESIEHVENGERLFDELINTVKPGGYLIFSVPNEEVNSLTKNNHPFHKHHYTTDEIIDILRGRVEIIKQYGQNVYQFNDGVQGNLLEEKGMDLLEGGKGQILLYVCQKPRKNIITRLWQAIRGE